MRGLAYHLASVAAFNKGGHLTIHAGPPKVRPQPSYGLSDSQVTSHGARVSQQHERLSQGARHNNLEVLASIILLPLPAEHIIVQHELIAALRLLTAFADSCEQRGQVRVRMLAAHQLIRSYSC